MFNFFSKKNPKNLSGYLFRVLLEPRYSQLYKNISSQAAPKPSKTAICPVCNTEFDGSDLKNCPFCGFDRDYFRDTDRIEFEKKLFLMPIESRIAYQGEIDLLNKEYLSHQDLKLRNQTKKVLDQKYGLA